MQDTPTPITAATPGPSFETIIERVKTKIATDKRHGRIFAGDVQVAQLAAEYTVQELRGRVGEINRYAKQEITRHLNARDEQAAKIEGLEALVEDLRATHPNKTIQELRETNRRLIEYSNNLFLQLNGVAAVAA